jgi:TusA-related sulfurtransferase
MTAKGIKEIESGQIMLLEVTDNGARSDIPAWATQTGNELVESEETDGVMKFYIRKK